MARQVFQTVYRKFQVGISSGQIKYDMKCNSIRNNERAKGSCRSGGASDAIDFLIQNMKSEVAQRVCVGMCVWFMHQLETLQLKLVCFAETEFKARQNEA
jgi:hypothetical protein